MNKNMLLVGSVVLIVLAIGMVAILDRSSSNSSNSTDVRARAAISKTLQMNGTVDSIDVGAGTITVSRVFLSSESRSGEAKDLGTWVVTAPKGFDFNSISQGASVKIGVDAKSFLASSHTMNAVSVTVSR